MRGTAHPPPPFSGSSLASSEFQAHEDRVVQADASWRRLQQLGEEKLSDEGLVTGNNGGGLFVTMMGVAGFCPGSHVPQAIPSPSPTPTLSSSSESILAVCSCMGAADS